MLNRFENWEMILHLMQMPSEEEWSPDRRADYIAEQTSLPRIGYGAFRAVFKNENEAIKIPLNPEGQDCNQREIRLWEDAPLALRNDIIPYLYGISSCAHFALAKTFYRVEEMIPYEEEIKRINENFQKHGYELQECGIEQFEQFGLYQGRLVVLDFGNYEVL